LIKKTQKGKNSAQKPYSGTETIQAPQGSKLIWFFEYAKVSFSVYELEKEVHCLQNEQFKSLTSLRISTERGPLTGKTQRI